ncbi:MAG: hypothetical protein M1823_003681 [Watsoniomyces obsoletus]|nr:MAG: hypothetical protein M1823_003681 [Watsoniomyces obsoletus]
MRVTACLLAVVLTSSVAGRPMRVRDIWGNKYIHFPEDREGHGDQAHQESNHVGDVIAKRDANSNPNGIVNRRALPEAEMLPNQRRLPAAIADLAGQPFRVSQNVENSHEQMLPDHESSKTPNRPTTNQKIQDHQTGRSTTPGGEIDAQRVAPGQNREEVTPSEKSTTTPEQQTHEGTTGGKTPTEIQKTHGEGTKHGGQGTSGEKPHHGSSPSTQKTEHSDLAGGASPNGLLQPESLWGLGALGTAFVVGKYHKQIGEVLLKPPGVHINDVVKSIEYQDGYRRRSILSEYAQVGDPPTPKKPKTFQKNNPIAKKLLNILKKAPDQEVKQLVANTPQQNALPPATGNSLNPLKKAPNPEVNQPVASTPQKALPPAKGNWLNLFKNAPNPEVNQPTPPQKAGQLIKQQTPPQNSLQGLIDPDEGWEEWDALMKQKKTAEANKVLMRIKVDEALDQKIKRCLKKKAQKLAKTFKIGDKLETDEEWELGCRIQAFTDRVLNHAMKGVDSAIKNVRAEGRAAKGKSFSWKDWIMPSVMSGVSRMGNGLSTAKSRPMALP